MATNQQHNGSGNSNRAQQVNTGMLIAQEADTSPKANMLATDGRIDWALDAGQNLINHHR